MHLLAVLAMFADGPLERPQDLYNSVIESFRVELKHGRKCAR